jgi:hypothetical protein
MKLTKVSYGNIRTEYDSLDLNKLGSVTLLNVRHGMSSLVWSITLCKSCDLFICIVTHIFFI